MIANLRTLGKFLDPQILPGEKSGTFRDSAPEVCGGCTWVVLDFSGKCRNQFFLLQILIFYDRLRTKTYPTSVHSLKLLTNAKIYIFCYIPHQNYRNVYFLTHGEENNLRELLNFK